MIYFNNAATTWPKPESVYEAVDDCFRNLNSPGRTTSDHGAHCSTTMQACRDEVAEFFGIGDRSRLVFTPSCTYALNLAILGQDWEAGEEALMSGLEHHAVSRPIRKLARERGVRFEVCPYQVDQPIDLDFVEQRLRGGRVRMVACTMASNVSGDIMPSVELGRLCRRYGAHYLVDCAQSAGVLPVDVEQLQADFLAFAGHKGLLAPPGIGGLYVREGITLNTMAEGGTGKDSGKHEMSGSFPSNFEVGTHNLMGIVGLSAGIRWIRQAGLDTIRAHEQALTRRFLQQLRGLDGVCIYGPGEVERRTALACLTMDHLTPQQIADHLAREHNVATRPGYHCAPLAHETIGTLPGDGAVRFSFGYFNSLAEVDAVAGMLGELADSTRSRRALAT